MNDNNEIARLTLTSKAIFIPAACEFVRSIAQIIGIENKDIDMLEHAVDEACTNVVKHAFEESEPGRFDIIIQKEKYTLLVTIEDKGLPFDINKLKEEKKKVSGLL